MKRYDRSIDEFAIMRNLNKIDIHLIPILKEITQRLTKPIAHKLPQREKILTRLVYTRSKIKKITNGGK